MIDPLDDTQDYPVRERAANSFFVDNYQPIQLNIAALTHLGKKRKENQDHYAVIRRNRTQEVLQSDLPWENIPNVEDESHLLVVADGIGGTAFGELASRLVIQKIWELTSVSASWVMRFSDLDSQQVRERLQTLSDEVQAHLDRESQGSQLRLDMVTTLTTAYIMGQDAIISHIGDSRAYLFREGELRQLTEDQTLAQKMLKLGYAADQVSDFHRVLANYFGTSLSEAPNFYIHSFELQESDRLLLCTDGLTNELTDEEIRDHLATGQEPQEACEELLQAALEQGGRDNITMILAKIGLQN